MLALTVLWSHTTGKSTVPQIASHVRCSTGTPRRAGPGKHERTGDDLGKTATRESSILYTNHSYLEGIRATLIVTISPAANVSHRPAVRTMHVEMCCGKFVCCECIIRHLQDNEPLLISCQCCGSSDDASPRPTAEVIVRVVGSLLVHCEHSGCGDVVQLQQLRGHLDSGCRMSGAPSPSKTTLSQILARPLSAPPTNTERKVATSIVKRLISTGSSPEPVQPNPHTSIQVPPCPHVSRPREATPEASQKMKRQRSYQLASVRQSVSGGVEAACGQLEDEFRILDKEERRSSCTTRTLQLSLPRKTHWR